MHAVRPTLVLLFLSTACGSSGGSSTSGATSGGTSGYGADAAVPDGATGGDSGGGSNGTSGTGGNSGSDANGTSTGADTGAPMIDPMTSGLPGSKKGSELTPDEGVSLCRWIDTKAATAAPLEGICTALAISQAERQDSTTPVSTCENLAEDCIDRGPGTNGVICTWTENSGTGTCVGWDPEADEHEGRCTFDECDVTIAEIEACTRALSQAFGNEARRADCTTAGDGTNKEMEEDQVLEGSLCKNVLENCPDF